MTTKSCIRPSFTQIDFSEPRGLPKSASYTTDNQSQDSRERVSANYVEQNFPFMRKIPQGAETSNILVGQVDFLEQSLSVFIRLNSGVILEDLTEVPVPTRFIYILLTPSSSTLGKYKTTIVSFN